MSSEAGVTGPLSGEPEAREIKSVLQLPPPAWGADRPLHLQGRAVGTREQALEEGGILRGRGAPPPPARCRVAGSRGQEMRSCGQTAFPLQEGAESHLLKVCGHGFQTPTVRCGGHSLSPLFFLCVCVVCCVCLCCTLYTCTSCKLKEDCQCPSLSH